MFDKPLDQLTVAEIDAGIDGLCKPIPLAGGAIAKNLKKAAHEDRDNNGKVDVLEWCVKAQRALDLMEQINEQVDFELLADYVDELPFIKDKPAMKATLHKVAKEIEDAQRLAKQQTSA